MPAPRGIGEVPTEVVSLTKDSQGNVKVNSSQLRRFLVDVREQVLQLRQRTSLPGSPTNLRATAQSFQNLVQWSRTADADYYEVVSALKPNLSDPSAVTTDVGNSVSWTDNVGNHSITKYYWVRARKLTGSSSPNVGPVSATTLAAGTGVTPPSPPPPAQILVLDRISGRVIPYVLAGERPYGE
jgi:plastocyanin